MTRFLTSVFLLMLVASAFAAVSTHEWTVTYFQSDCDLQCLPWFPMDADSAKVHNVLQVNGADTVFYLADTTLFY